VTTSTERQGREGGENATVQITRNAGLPVPYRVDLLAWLHGNCDDELIAAQVTSESDLCDLDHSVFIAQVVQ
jgi:hypothetical protein